LPLTACRTARAPADSIALAPARDPRVAVAEALATADPALAFEIAYIEGNSRVIARERIEKGLAEAPDDPALHLRHAFLAASELKRKEALHDLLAIIEKAPASGEAEIALVFLNSGLTDHLAEANEIARAINGSQILAGRALSAPRAALASSIMSRIDSLAKDETAMHVHIAQGGWLTNWRAIGPLGPRTEIALRKPTEHETNGIDESSAALIRGFRPPVRTLPVHRYVVSPVAGDQAGLYVMESYFEIGDVARGQPLEIDVHLRDPGRVRLDGVKIHEIVDGQRRSAGDRRLTIDLQPGWHRVSVALLATNASRPTISILGYDGSPVIVAESATPPPRPLVERPPEIGSSSISLDDKTSGDSLIERSVADPKHTLFGRLVASHLALTVFREDYDRARVLLQPALEAAPASAALIATDAEIMFRTGLPQSIPQARFRDALAADEDNPEMLMALARSIADESPENALSLLERVEKASPKAAEPHELRFRIYQKKGWNAEAAESLERALELRTTESILAEAASFYRGLLRIDRALELEKKALEIAEPGRPSRQAAAALLRGDIDRAIADLREAARSSLGRSAHEARIAELELGRGKIEQAIEAAGRALAEDPLHAGALRTLAVALEAKGDRKGALASIDRIRAIGATDIHLEKLAADLSGDGFARPKPGSFLAAVLAHDPKTLERSANDTDLRWSRHKNVRLLDRVVDYVGADGHSVSVRHAITRLQTKEATDQAGEIHLPNEALPLALRTIKADGRIIDVDRHPGKDDLSFSALAPGDAVEKEWVSVEGAATPWGGYMRRFYFQGASPSLRAEYVVVVPQGTKVWWKSYHGAPEAEVKSEDGRDVYVFRKKDIPAVDPEPSSVPHEEYLAFVVVTIGLDEKLALETNGLSVENLARSGPEVRRAAKAIAKGANGEEEQVRAIYEWLAREVGHGGARDPDIVLATRRGDRTGLFVAMLRSLGIKADIALGRTGAAPRVTPSYPNPSRYGIELARVALAKANKTIWARMDLETPWIGKATPDLRSGDYILPELRDGALEPIPFADEEVERWMLTSLVDLTVDAEGTAKGSVSIALPGAYGAQLRDFLKRARKEDVSRALEGWAAAVLPGAKLERYHSKNTERPLEPLEVEVAVVVPHFMVIEAGHLIAEQFFNVPIATRALGFPTLATYLRVPSRSTPLYLNELGEQMSISIVLPQGTETPVEAPKSFKKVERYGRFEQEFTFDPKQRTAKMTAVQSLPALRLSAKEFEKFRDGAQEILQATRNRLIIPIKAPVRQARTPSRVGS
jgi:tetratricopeptide (TPR) repeat protein